MPGFSISMLTRAQGTLPPEWGEAQAWPSLGVLDLSYQYLAGTIPLEVRTARIRRGTAAAWHACRRAPDVRSACAVDRL